MLPYYTFEYIWFNITSNTKWQNILKWIASAHISTAAILVTVWPEHGLMLFPFAIFLIGHIIWSVFAFLMKEKALFTINLFFVGLDSYGVFVRL